MKVTDNITELIKAIKETSRLIDLLAIKPLNKNKYYGGKR
tara:strand:+ start:84 stop:203 length:120 start_codon:yes stop_codon:yes gene_type:complete